MKNAMQLVAQHNLQPGDVIVVGRNFGFIAHYLVFMGSDDRGHWFMANMEDGVKKFDHIYLQSRSNEFFFKRIRRFEGNMYQRQEALRRAESRLGEPYSLTKFNCEHFANYVQYRVEKSKQVQVAQAGLGVAAGLSLVWLIGKLLGGDGDEESSGRYS